ncbi:MAG: Na(+)-translocating NADH-quinone reductase subunit A [Endozoicomonadaceae bacterium]|nr:Na(+)-translocating NADH-quinone reductase subunit A [Endozoicomonadaceae bacterium]MBE8232506.1 Na(+)-translocating NADH-quinone reductase subunit A [Endozoicomonadaceae bacterium]
MTYIKKGLDLPILGVPDQQISDAKPIKQIAVLGHNYVHMKPTLLVSEGEEVLAGQPLFSDKKNPKIKYTTPVSGVVSSINRGEKRVLQSIVVTCNHKPGLSFSAFKKEQLKTLKSEQIISQLLASGLWTAFRTRPYSRTPDPDSVPSAIFVTAIDTRPLSANPAGILSQYKAQFEAGLIVLKQLHPIIYVCTAPGVRVDVDTVKQAVFSGPHPAGLPGTHIHFLSPVSMNKQVWHLNYQDVIAIGYLFLMGTLWAERIIAIGGPKLKKPRLIRACLGASLNDLLDNEIQDGPHRVISGSVLDGDISQAPCEFLGRYHLQVSVLEEAVSRTFLHYLRLGVTQFSVMPVYWSRFLNKRFNMTTSTQGSPRAMVPIGSYERVMPLDILPTQLLRALIVQDVEMAEKLGMLELDEEDLALCTFVCPGKYEYGPILRDNLTIFEKEG